MAIWLQFVLGMTGVFVFILLAPVWHKLMELVIGFISWVWKKLDKDFLWDPFDD